MHNVLTLQHFIIMLMYDSLLLLTMLEVVLIINWCNEYIAVEKLLTKVTAAETEPCYLGL